MKNKKTIYLSMLFCIVLASCGKNDKHVAKETWTYDTQNHWHECITKGHDDKIELANHKFNEGFITTNPTETKEGVKTFTCKDCNYQKEVTIPKLEHTHTFATTYTATETSHYYASTCGHDVKKDESAHNFNEGFITTNPTETKEGVKTFTCKDCNYQKEVTIPKLEHTHTFATTYTATETSHYYASTCGHDVKKDEQAHKFSSWVEEKKASYGETGSNIRTCEVCEYVERETVPALEAKDNTITLKNEEVLTKVYDGKYIALSSNDIIRNGNGKITFSYKKKNSTTDFNTSSFKNVGEYLVKVNVEATKEWKALERTFEYVIVAKSVSATLTKVYDGDNEITGKVTGAITNDDVSLKVTMTSKDVNSTIESFELLGNDKDNYSLDINNIQASITTKTLKFEESTLTKVYDGTNTFTYTFDEDHGTIEEECKYSFDLYDYHGKTPIINVGNYTDLTYQNGKVDNNNYLVDNIGLSDSQETSITITKKVLDNMTFLLLSSSLKEETGVKTIKRLVSGTNNKVFVNITFDVQDLKTNHSLTLTTSTRTQGTAEIEFFYDEDENYLNCEFAPLSLGTIRLLNY